ncbi:MAG: hypothetical protein JNK99_15315 [Candidatus Accumulibacter sp.]|uniref:hypothetical protein n=1 Tax=Accumulibacter sp. TaxID=2053492 RepID=UPI001A397EDE|nr:hypothetical protein [Accumulibacter sp.]MBL8396089.1 hypothetical protein [Accumulibacter sp.]
MNHVEQSGVQFPCDATGKRSSSATGREIVGAALARVAPTVASAVRAESHWRQAYPRHFRALVEASLGAPGNALSIAADGLHAAASRLEFVRGGVAGPVVEAMLRPCAAALRTVELRGRAEASPVAWAVPYRGRQLRGEALRERIAAWQKDDIIEPGCARALHRLLDHPEWFDLSDRHLVLLSAASEAGPLAWLARWRANIVAVDLPQPELWKHIARLVEAGNGRLLAPLAGGKALPIEQAGANLLTQTPEIAAWLVDLGRSVDLAALAYADGALHVRLAVAMDAIIGQVSAAQPGSSLMFMATPTDVFAVSALTAQAALRRFAERGVLTRVADVCLQSLSGGRLLRPSISNALPAGVADPCAIVDALVVEQGPNYALAKRLQQWRALCARAAGQRVSLNVAPPSTTRSVTRSPVMQAAYRGAAYYGIEVFEPATTAALAAGLWVHDLRCDVAVANPRRALQTPLELLVEQANHGGLWRLGYQARSVMPLAAARGWLGSHFSAGR